MISSKVPGYILPSRRRLNEMLRETYMKIKEEAKKDLRDNIAALAADSWTSDANGCWYQDDDFEAHVKRVEKIFSQISKANMTLNSEKI